MSMRFRLPALSLALALATAGVSAQTATATKKLDLKIDATALTQTANARLVSYADVVEPVQKTVVSVYSTKIVRQRMQMNPFFRELFGDQAPPERESREEGLGSGVIVTADGYIITNNHVVEGADELNVSLSDDREFKAKVIGADPKTDIAIIKIEAEDLPTATLADSDRIRVGDVVFAVGNPLGIGQTVTMGIVSAKGRSVGILDDVQGYEDFIQTDAAINQGNSGGALVDAAGRLVGINSAILSTSRGNIGIGFAVPVNLAASIMRSLIETGTVSRGQLGVQVDPLTPELAEALGIKKDTRGVMIVEVVPDSAAEAAGLERSDVIVSVNDRPVTSSNDIRLLISQLPPGTEVRLAVIREGDERVVKATLGAVPGEAAAQNELLEGITVDPLSDDLRRQLGIPRNISGVAVSSVDADSPYASTFVEGMVVLEINRKPVTDAATARTLLREGRNLLYVYTRGAIRSLVVVIER
ncbi:MAG TPA: Do family serine endopeptidase [Opitutaceae bacterium]